MWSQKGYELLKAVTPRSFEVMDQLSTACGKLAKEYSYPPGPVARNKYAAEYMQIAEAIMQMNDKDLPESEKQRFSMKWHYFLLEEAKPCAARGAYCCFQRALCGHRNMDGKSGKPGIPENSLQELQIALLLHENQLEDAEKIARENVQSARHVSR